MRSIKQNILYVVLCSFITFGIWTFKQNLTSHGQIFPNEDKGRMVGPPSQSDEQIIKFLRSKYLDNPSSNPYNLSTDPVYISTKNAFSWPFIQNYIQELFKNQTGGFFIEAGALDGEYLSNTLLLEKELNWTGLLIEPDPDNYQELIKKNRKAWTSNACLSSDPYPKQTVLVSLKDNRLTNPNYSGNSWIYRGSSHELRITIPPLQKYKQFYAKTTSRNVTVQCFPLFSYLLALNKTKVDLIVLDLQGSEKEVLKTLPFNEIKVKVFVVEHTDTLSLIDEDLENFFQQRGYRLIGCGAEPDYIYVLREAFPQFYFPKVMDCHTG